jgi:ferredoxin
MKAPVIDTVKCVACDACIEACPAVFLRNKAGGIAIAGLPVYPEEEINQAIKRCMGNCIARQNV